MIELKYKIIVLDKVNSIDNRNEISYNSGMIIVPQLSAIEKGTLSNSGYYEVGNLVFNNKLEALYTASKTKQMPRWNFHDKIFSKVDWSKPTSEPLNNLYKERAAEIRDKYDFISLSFSGGADSWNVLNSFLSNNIHVDEIYTRFPLSGTRKYMSANTEDKSAKNLTSEYEYAVKPVLDHVSKNFPKIKITVDDITESYFEEVTDDEIIRAGHFALNGLSAKRCANNLGIETGSSDKKIASVRGCGKIQIFYEKNNFYLYFSDVEAWPVDADPNFSLEYFYWGATSTELIRGQAHAVMRYFKTNPKFLYLIERIPTELPDGTIENLSSRNIDKKMLRLYDEIVKTICYPNWDPNTFQTDKSHGIIFDREDDFWILEQNPRSVQSWKWSVNQFFKGIDKRAYRKLPDDRSVLKSFMSNFYYLGSI